MAGIPEDSLRLARSKLPRTDEVYSLNAARGEYASSRGVDRLDNNARGIENGRGPDGITNESGFGD